jgi:hypothetical protein
MYFLFLLHYIFIAGHFMQWAMAMSMCLGPLHQIELDLFIVSQAKGAVANQEMSVVM